MTPTTKQREGKRSRRRGYNWERKLTDILIQKGWSAWRLGAPQIHLPDILAIHSDGTLLCIECKSTTRDMCIIPIHQIEMCFGMIQPFKKFVSKCMVIGAFSFVGNSTQYYTTIQHVGVGDLVCTIDGRVYRRGLHEYSIQARDTI
ncbi:MAG: hypothetical protein F4Z07_06155 [Dehalococcoidia bacterium]|nr:hypothetical protein [Dehalococcoidia bacterium]